MNSEETFKERMAHSLICFLCLALTVNMSKNKSFEFINHIIDIWISKTEDQLKISQQKRVAELLSDKEISDTEDVVDILVQAHSHDIISMRSEFVEEIMKVISDSINASRFGPVA